MPHIAQIAVGLLFALGLGLFVFNMFQARQGWNGMKQAKAQKTAMDAEFAGMRGKVARSERLRADLKARYGSQYASVELADGANLTAMETIGAIRNSASHVESQMTNLENDSLSGDSDLNSEVSVLNKINATGVLTLRSIQDANKLLASLLEQQVVSAKQQREMTTNAINADIERRADLAGNMNQLTGTLTSSLQNFRIP